MTQLFYILKIWLICVEVSTHSLLGPTMYALYIHANIHGSIRALQIFKNGWRMTEPERSCCAGKKKAPALDSGASSARRGWLTADPARLAALGGPRERRFAGPAVGPHGGAHAFLRPCPCALLVLY
jgi:hypothetical protein